MKCMECLNEDVENKKIWLFLYMCRDNTIIISAKLLEITYESYGFTADLIEPIN